MTLSIWVAIGAGWVVCAIALALLLGRIMGRLSRVERAMLDHAGASKHGR